MIITEKNVLSPSDEKKMMFASSFYNSVKKLKLTIHKFLLKIYNVLIETI